MEIYANTLEFLDDVFDKSVEQLELMGGKELFKAEFSLPQDIGNWHFWIKRAAIIDFRKTDKYSPQLALSVCQRNFTEHLPFWEFNCGALGLAAFTDYPNYKNTQFFLANMPTGFTSTDTTQGVAVRIFGDLDGENLDIDGARPDDFADTEELKEIKGILGRMDSLANLIKAPHPSLRINQPGMLQSCISYVELIKHRVEATFALGEKDPAIRRLFAH